MTSFVKKEVCDDGDSAEETETGILKDEASLPSGELTVHPTDARPDEVAIDGSIEADEVIEGDSSSQDMPVTKPEIIWFIKTEPIDEEEPREEVSNAHSTEYKRLLVTPKLEEFLLPSCEERSSTFDDSSLHPNLLDHNDKIQDGQQRTKHLREKPDWNSSGETKEIPDSISEGGQGLIVKEQSKVYLPVNSETATDEINYKCVYCYKNFGKRRGLQRHLKTHTGEKHFECTQCNKKFRIKGNLLTHLRTHTGEKPFECSLCNKRFSEKGTLQNHLKTHTGEKPFECIFCHKKCSRKGDLQIHLRIHTGEKPFECTQCDMKFRLKGNLLNHLTIHTGEKPFECNLCNDKFTREANLRRHSRTHTGEKPFECSQCNRQFSEKRSLHKHLKVHMGDKHFECIQCDAKFSDKGHLQRHLKIH